MPLDKVLGIDSATGEIRTASFYAFGSRQFLAAQGGDPNSGDWAVNVLAPVVVDPSNSGINVRQFDDTIEQGVGGYFIVPSLATNARITFITRPQTAPGAPADAIIAVYQRGLLDNGTLEAWSSKITVGTITYQANANRQYATFSGSFAAFGITPGDVTQFEFTRDAANAGDTLVGNMLLESISIEFT